MATRNARGNGGSVFTALVFMVPGIILYFYILYIMVAKLVYPASFLPFHTTLPFTPKPENSGVLHPVIWDGALLVAFAFQHSVMASEAVKGLFQDVGLQVVFRPVYIFMTCFTINVINYSWMPCSETLWRWDNNRLIMFLVAVHLLSWLSIACSLFTIDYLELLGIKQIYYSYYGFNQPMSYKSEEQQQLLSHNRHPIFLAPTVILWAVPFMSYDRLLVAVMLPLYIGLAGSVDTLDRSYVSDQYVMKKYHLLQNGARN